MTLGEFAILLDADPKWVQNAAAALGGSLRFTVTHAQRLAVARVLTESPGMPLAKAYHVAGRVLREFTGQRQPVTIETAGDPFVSVTIDLYRILARVSARLSWLRTEHQPKRRGRPGKRRNPLLAAREYGLDPGLLQYNLSRTPLERLRQLDAMVDFRRRVRRV